MSYRTDKLAALFPDAYAAGDAGSLLHKLLDAVGAELARADGATQRLMRSHWVDYAEGAALDGLGAVYGVERRRLRGGALESDDGFRARLKSVVRLFTGGGTVKAVRDAVKSALGLPIDLADLRLPPGLDALRGDIEALVRLEEFSPRAERAIGDTLTTVAHPLPPHADASQLLLQADFATVAAARPQILWTFTGGGGRRLRLERVDSGQGLQASDRLLVREGSTLELSADEKSGRLTALLDGADVSAEFTGLDGGNPILPQVPAQASEWTFLAQGGLMDVSGFDGGDSYDPPAFRVDFRLVTQQPLTFDVHVPYFLQAAVNGLAARHGFTGSVFVFEGLPPERIQEVVNQTKAAGVQGSVHFSLDFIENHAQSEALALKGTHAWAEDAGAAEAFSIGSFEKAAESQGMAERFALGGVYDISNFDESFGFQ